jgi:CDP-glucose 4,6-dehydratase
VEDLEVKPPQAFGGTFKGKTVLVTGHTGFKGAWLCLWLKELGAKVVGLSLPPAVKPNLYERAGLGSLMESHFADLRDPVPVARLLRQCRPQIIFHLAAQALVRSSYDDPAGTFSTNVLGTVNLLDAVRAAPSVRVCQVITSDKCYENRETDHAYNEGDRLGGRDPYSASKACAELVVASYRDSFFPLAQIKRHRVSLSSARAGNVIGGGDWAKDRLIPDCVRCLRAGKPILVRNPASVRPWQHVLEPLGGYLRLAALQLAAPARYAQAWNFGPSSRTAKVADVVDLAIGHWGGGKRLSPSSRRGAPHEARLLRLDCGKARRLLGWRSVYSLEQGIAETIRWYRGFYLERGFDASSFTRGQIRDYAAAAQEHEWLW